MFDGLLSRGFAAKCKSLIKLTKNRIDVIRRKRKATEKFLKKDMADLLANGLDVNAYGRAEGLIGELTLTACYDFVEWTCDFVLKHLSVLQKLSGCPEECREAIACMIIAAARFSDLPELRDLRQIFQERYGNSLECYVNQEFAANLNPKSFTLEQKVRLMQEISSEFSIKWDSKAFELRMSKSSASAQKSPDYSNDGHKFRNGKEAAVSKGDENHLHLKSKLSEKGYKPISRHDEVSLPRDSHGNPLPGREELTSQKGGYWKEGSMLKPPFGCSSQDKRVQQFDNGSDLHNKWGNATRVRESQDTATARKSPNHAGIHSKSSLNEPFAVNHVGLPDLDNSQRKVQKDETPRNAIPPPYVKPNSIPYSNAIPPPYVKPNSKLKNNTRIDNDGIPTTPSIHQKPDAASTTEKIRSVLDNSEQDLQASRHARLSKQDYEKEPPVREDAEEIPVLKQKSMRRKHSKSRSTHNDANKEDSEVARKSRSRRRDESKRGLQILFDDEQHKKDEEERVIDRLLLHYCKKPSSVSGHEKARRRSKSRHAHQIDDGPDKTPDMVPRARSVSLPHDQTQEAEVNKVFTRAASFQPDRSKEARHVHPKLPDYDDLAARLAALRGT
ncbi:unnamed protein product [Trifolium pratense]|uniref:Uncharacterized protein n=1 Tax=Trifolium pratense TaxID=57577 RepID=A0ACB0IXE4_TRIPR|nr:unnamed protein product [Trifolium pratense]